MLAKVLLVSFKNQYVKMQLADGRIVKYDRKLMPFVKRGDICTLSEYRGRVKANLLTDDDESVKMHQLVPYGYWAKAQANPPEPIITPT